MMIFTKDACARILAGKQSATLEPIRVTILPGSVRRLRRRTMRHDGDGNELGLETSTVEQGEGEDRAPVLLTILTVSMIQLPTLSLQQAQWCGYKTVIGCQTAWDADHPGVELAQLVRFALGDLRDRDRYLARTVGYTATRHLSADPDAAVVPTDEQRRQILDSRKNEIIRLADPDVRLRNELQRALEHWELETGGRASTLDAHKAIRGIRDRIRSLDRRLKAA